MKNRKPSLWKAAAILTLSTLPSSLLAQSQTPSAPATGGSTFFPFVIPWDDATPNVATDMSYLNAKPAGVNGRIVARDGHFVEEKTGKRTRFLGTNFTFSALFPPHADAERVAAHLAKMGINIVRIHHHDFNEGALWDKRFTDHQHLSADSVDRLDYLIYQFKRNGIYVDLNLHVSRKFTPEDGFPASVNDIKTEFDKRVDNYDRRMIELQKKFANDYLTHVNSYTKLPYTSDPCVAMIEINNENTLVGSAGTTLAAGLDDLPEPFRGELVGLWNTWLSKRYKSDAALQTAWRFGDAQTGPSLVNASSRWTLEDNGLHAAMVTGPDAGTNSAPVAAPPIEITAPKIDDQFWHIQSHVTGLNLKSGAAYTVTFQAKADAPRTMTVYAGMDQADWHHVGLDSVTRVGTDWKTFTLPFQAIDTTPDHSRLTFVIGNQVGKVSIRNVALTPGVAPTLATGGGTLAAKTIEMPAAGSLQERADWVHFLADTERDYAEEMRKYVKVDLKAKANVICSQIEYGASAGMYREQNMDFADGHAYWQHPSFPGKPWDSTNWTIANTPMVAELAKTGGTLLNLAEYRVAGKPYSVTEYNEPAPSDFQCETLPELASFAALQDWDAIFLFDWGSYGESAGSGNEKIQSYFGVGSNPAKTAFLPAAALLFRGEQVDTAEVITRLALPARATLMGLPLSTFWGQSNPGSLASLLDSRLSVRVVNRSDGEVIPTVTHGMHREELYPSSSLSVDPLRARFLSGQSGAVTGYVGGNEIQVGPTSIKFPKFGNNFCAVTVTRLRKESDLLLTIVGKVENVGMTWNANRTSVGNRWGTGPTQAEFVPATVTVTGTTKTHIWALDAQGKRTREIPTSQLDNAITFSTSPEAHTVWYEITSVK